MNDVKLKSCPFCGGSAAHYCTDDRKPVHYVACTRCGMSGICGNSDNKAAEHWNTRAAPTFTQGDVLRVANAIIKARETLYDTVKNATNSEPTNSNLQARHMRNDLAEFLAKAALDAAGR